MLDPLLILLLGLLTVVGLIAAARIHPFLALLAGALVVSFASPLPAESVGGFGTLGCEKITRVAEALGVMAGKISILIAFGAIIGKCLTESGAAERIVLLFCRLFGVKRLPAALLSSGFFLSIPVFYDVTFYLLLPLAQTVHRLTRRHYILYLLAIGFGATLSHTLVPPTPGPLVVAGELGVPLGAMIGIGVLVGVCTIPFALIIATVLDRTMPNPPMRAGETEAAPSEPVAQNGEPITLDDLLSGKYVDPTEHLPSAAAALFPIFLPVVLIAASSVVDLPAVAASMSRSALAAAAGETLRLLGNASVALGLSAICAAAVLVRHRRLSRHELEKMIQSALLGAGLIILITSAGGAFGAMLRQSGIGERIEELFAHGHITTGPAALTAAFLIAAVIKTAQGSSTTAMITVAGIFAAMDFDAAQLGFHSAYLAAAIGTGSMVTGWMNDSGFCIFAGMSGVTETAALKTWTVGLVTLGLSAFTVIVILSQILPFV